MEVAEQRVDLLFIIFARLFFSCSSQSLLLTTTDCSAETEQQPRKRRLLWEEGGQPDLERSELKLLLWLDVLWLDKEILN